jgi:hypothetical protein
VYDLIRVNRDFDSNEMARKLLRSEKSFDDINEIDFGIQARVI